MELDANTLAEWGADYIKLDGCYSPPESHAKGYILIFQLFKRIRVWILILKVQVIPNLESI